MVKDKLILYQYLMNRNALTKPVDIIITASHHHVLPYWFKAAEEGVIPKSGVSVLHIDAHPDLSTPEGEIPRRLPSDIYEFQESVSIASFQLAAMYSGLVNKSFWIRPHWAEQIEDGLYDFNLGVTSENRINVDLSIDYYIADQTWSPIQHVV